MGPRNRHERAPNKSLVLFTGNGHRCLMDANRASVDIEMHSRQNSFADAFRPRTTECGTNANSIQMNSRETVTNALYQYSGEREPRMRAAMILWPLVWGIKERLCINKRFFTVRRLFGALRTVESV